MLAFSFFMISLEELYKQYASFFVYQDGEWIKESFLEWNNLASAFVSIFYELISLCNSFGIILAIVTHSVLITKKWFLLLIFLRDSLYDC